MNIFCAELHTLIQYGHTERTSNFSLKRVLPCEAMMRLIHQKLSDVSFAPLRQEANQVEEKIRCP